MCGVYVVCGMCIVCGDGVGWEWDGVVHTSAPNRDAASQVIVAVHSVPV